jgi:excisionase family DNA binding protein
MQGEDFYTVEEAARALKLTPDRIRQMLRDGEIEGVPPLEGGASGWKIPVRVVQDRDRPPPMVRPEAPAVGSESLPGPEDTSGPEDMRGEEAPSPTPAQPEREDAAVDSREPTKPPTPHISVREAARNLETSVEALLETGRQRPDHRRPARPRSVPRAAAGRPGRRDTPARPYLRRPHRADSTRDRGTRSREADKNP